MGVFAIPAYGSRSLAPFTRVRDFEKSFYKFIKDNYADSHGYPVHYGDDAVDVNAYSIWLTVNFSELNVETGKFSSAYIDVITRIGSIDEYNIQLSVIIDDLRELFVNSDIDLYDFTHSENPQKVAGSKLLIQDVGKQVYERVEELELEGTKSLLQASQMTVKMKLLENFSRSRTV